MRRLCPSSVGVCRRSLTSLCRAQPATHGICRDNVKVLQNYPCGKKRAGPRRVNVYAYTSVQAGAIYKGTPLSGKQAPSVLSCWQHSPRKLQQPCWRSASTRQKPRLWKLGHLLRVVSDDARGHAQPKRGWRIARETGWWHRERCPIHEDRPAAVDTRVARGPRAGESRGAKKVT